MKRIITSIALGLSTLALSACGSTQKPQPEVVQAPAPTPRDTVVRAPVVAEPVVVAEAAPACEPRVTVYFPLDVAQLDARDQAALTQSAACLRGGESQVNIEGHADPRGTEAYNLGLAERRANAVKRYLVALGVDGERLNTISYGEIYATGDSPAEWKRDRRAAIQTVTPPGASR